MTSEGMGMQADWIAMRRMTLAYPPLAMAPTRRAMIFCDMQVQVYRVQGCSRIALERLIDDCGSKGSLR